MLTLHCQCAVTLNHMQLDKRETYMYVRTNRSTENSAFDVVCFCYNVRLEK